MAQLKIVLAFLFFGALAHSAGVPKLPKFKVTKLSPYHVIVDFEDGRQAQTLAQVFPVKNTNFRLELKESTCPVQFSSPKCHVLLPLERQIAAFVWTRNPLEPEKVGQPVIRRYVNHSSGNEYILSAPEVLLRVVDSSNEMVNYRRSPVPEDLKLKITCEDPNLLAPFTKEDGQLEVLSMASELNIANVETGVSENRGVQMLEDAIFEKQKQSYVWQSFKNHTGDLTIFAAQILHWNIVNKKGELCEMNFSVEASQVQGTADELEGKNPDPTKLEPITWVGNNGEIKTFLRDLEDELYSTEGVLE